GAGVALWLTGIGHRGITHSLFFMARVAFAAYAAAQSGLWTMPISMALVAGVLVHLAGDMLTMKGLPLLYPFRANFKIAPGIVLQFTSWIIESFVAVGAVVVIGLCIWRMM